MPIRVFGIVAHAVQKAFSVFSDTFNRTTSGGLGTSSSNGAWSTLRNRGTWFANGSAAQTNDAASTYPLANIPMSKSNVTMNIKGGGQGTGGALWVTDSGNWWAVVTGQNPGESCNCQTCSQCNAWTTSCNAGNFYCTSSTCNAYACSSYNSQVICNSSSSQCNASNPGNCTRYNSTKNCATWNARSCYQWLTLCNAYSIVWNCSSWFCQSSSCNAGNFTCNSYSSSCNSTSYYSCNCQTCYPPFVRIIQSASNTVSEITKWIISSAAAALRITTSGQQITTKAYSDAGQVTQIGSDLIYTANNAAVHTNFGIVVAPSAYSQGNTIDEFDVTSN